MKKKLVVLTGAGMSAESGLSTFRDSGGLWENYETLQDVHMGDLAEDGGQLRPHIVWFGEMVPEMEKAIEITQNADLFLIIGSSLQVYPAASLLDFVPVTSKVYVIDPKPVETALRNDIIFIQKGASEGLEYFKNHYIE